MLVTLEAYQPSGVAEPSHADEFITQRIKADLALLDIPLLDHIIVAMEAACRRRSAD